MPCIHILTKQCDLNRPTCDKPSCFFKNLACWPGKFCPSCVGYNTETAEFVTPFLNRQKGGWSAWKMLFGKQIEFNFFWKLNINNMFAGVRVGLRYQFGKPVICLRSNNHIYPWRAPGDFLALRLSHTACHSNKNLFILLLCCSAFDLP